MLGFRRTMTQAVKYRVQMFGGLPPGPAKARVRSTNPGHGNDWLSSSRTQLLGKLICP